MAHFGGCSRLVLAVISAMALSTPLAPGAAATPISDQMAADMYKSCYDYCIGGTSADDCKHMCTCSIRLTEKQLTLEETQALGNGTASADVVARMNAISAQCSQ